MSSPIAAPAPADLAPALEDLGVPAAEVVLGTGSRGSHLLVSMDRGPDPDQVETLVANLDPGGILLLFVPEPDPDHSHLTVREVATWRNALWPELHVGRQYDFYAGQVVRHTLAGKEAVGQSPLAGTLLVAQRRAEVMSPEATVQKFDQNAAGWDGEPGSAGYPHHRWMRRYVGLFAGAPAPGARILDFGCGAGWCGVEAARRAPGSSLCSFDPSPEMVRITGENARRSGVTDFTGRTGFGEDPPFPQGTEEPFDLVISSGVISFSPDPERWLDGLCETVRPGGTLVVGDINGGSRGFQRRRATKPLLPVRELNARTREEVRVGLERRGFVFERWAGYQLTRPIPQLMHLNETRLHGALTYPLLWANQLSAAVDGALGSPLQDRFDSWVIRLRRS